jgi:Holliday junction DNA helicase RuvA
MIGFLSGTVKSKAKDTVLLLVNGVGYLINVVPNSLPVEEYYIHSHIREDCFDLYGFSNPEDLSVFRMLLGVSGVGPKTAMLVMERGANAIRNAITKADTGFFTLIPRLGTKNAQKIIIELKNKIGGGVDLDLSSDTNEILDSLISMGYKRTEAAEALKNLPLDIPIEEKLKLALKSLAKKL